MDKGRAVLALLLVMAGAGLLTYGLFYNSIMVFSKPVTPPIVPGLQDEPSPVDMEVVAQAEPASEPAVTQEVARGGVARDEEGRIKKTYEGTEAPKACPT